MLGFEHFAKLLAQFGDPRLRVIRHLKNEGHVKTISSESQSDASTNALSSSCNKCDAFERHGPGIGSRTCQRLALNTCTSGSRGELGQSISAATTSRCTVVVSCLQISPPIMSRVEDTYESQNDQRLDELHSKIRTLRGVSQSI